MSLRSWFLAIPRKVLIYQIAGFCIFVMAFFLPACHVGGSGTFAENVLGWECAKTAIETMPYLFQKTAPYIPYYVFLAIVISGWINPLILIYLSFSLTSKHLWIHKFIAIAILICIVITWIFFSFAHFVPLIGHFLWIAGALLILAPEALFFKRKPFNEDQSLPPSI
jgi:hypothetical protein